MTLAICNYIVGTIVFALLVIYNNRKCIKKHYLR